MGFILQLVAMYLPFFQNVFQTVSLGLSDWLIVFSVGLIDIIAIEISKWFFIHRVDKNKVAMPFRAAEVRIMYNTGIDLRNELADVARDEGIIEQVSDKKYTYKDYIFRHLTI